MFSRYDWEAGGNWDQDSHEWNLGSSGVPISLPADVLWGSFVTHSSVGRNECVTNEPQRTSAGRLGFPWGNEAIVPLLFLYVYFVDSVDRPQNFALPRKKIEWLIHDNRLCVKLRVTTPFFKKLPSVAFEWLVRLVPVVHVDCKLGTTTRSYYCYSHIRMALWAIGAHSFLNNSTFAQGTVREPVSSQ